MAAVVVSGWLLLRRHRHLDQDAYASALLWLAGGMLVMTLWGAAAWRDAQDAPIEHARIADAIASGRARIVVGVVAGISPAGDHCHPNGRLAVGGELFEFNQCGPNTELAQFLATPWPPLHAGDTARVVVVDADVVQVDVRR